MSAAMDSVAVLCGDFSRVHTNGLILAGQGHRFRLSHPPGLCLLVSYLTAGNSFLGGAG